MPSKNIILARTLSLQLPFLQGRSWPTPCDYIKGRLRSTRLEGYSRGNSPHDYNDIRAFRSGTFPTNMFLSFQFCSILICSPNKTEICDTLEIGLNNVVSRFDSFKKSTFEFESSSFFRFRRILLLEASILFHRLVSRDHLGRRNDRSRDLDLAIFLWIHQEFFENYVIPGGRKAERESEIRISGEKCGSSFREERFLDVSRTWANESERLPGQSTPLVPSL